MCPFRLPPVLLAAVYELVLFNDNLYVNETRSN